jgi:hypothetical protein
VKLAVSPQPRSIGEPVGVNTSQYLAVKVYGTHSYIQHITAFFYVTYPRWKRTIFFSPIENFYDFYERKKTV